MKTTYGVDFKVIAKRGEEMSTDNVKLHLADGINKLVADMAKLGYKVTPRNKGWS